MATHLGMTEPQMQASLEEVALWQLYLPAALSGSRWDFDAVRTALPHSYQRAQDALSALRARPQLAVVAFHMAAFPLVCSLLGAAARSTYGGPMHVVVATHNLGWLRHEHSRWLGESVVVLSTTRRDLRQLLTGLGNGEIRRLLVLADGPHTPGSAGTRALGGISPALGFRTALLERLHAFGIPLQPFTHAWEAQRLVVRPEPLLDPACISAHGSVSAVATHIEWLLRSYPAQWLNWVAATIRT